MIERRKQNLDPIDVYSVETWELLKLCGAVRKSDLPEASTNGGSGSMPERRHAERRRQGADITERGKD